LEVKKRTFQEEKWLKIYKKLNNKNKNK